MLFTSSIDNIPNIHVVLFFPCAWTFLASVWRWIFRLDDRFRLIKDSGIYPRDMQALGMKEVFPGSRSIFVSLIPLSEITGDISGLSTEVCFTPSSLSPYNWFIFHILRLLANIKRWCALYSAASTSNVTQVRQCGLVFSPSPFWTNSIVPPWRSGIKQVAITPLFS